MSNTSWIRGNGSKAKQFTWDWFSSGAKWLPKGDDLTVIRKALSRLSYLESYELIKLLLAKQVMSAEELGNVLDCPKLRSSLQKRHAAIAAIIPKLQKWIKPGCGTRTKHAPLRK